MFDFMLNFKVRAIGVLSFAAVICVLGISTLVLTRVHEIHAAVDASKAILTQQEMEEDFDALWVALEENYPFWGVLERAYQSKGVEADYYETARNKYREMIAEIPEDKENIIDFMILINTFLKDIGGNTGHLGVIPPDLYVEGLSVYRDLYAELPMLKPWVDVIDDEDTARRYEAYLPAYIRYAEAMQGAAAESGAAQTADVPEAPPNMETKIIEEGKTALLTIRSFGDQFRADDVPAILEFYKEIAGYENLIIDITENSGGNVMYWMEAIVAPNITEEITLENHFMMRGGEIAKRFYGFQYEGSEITPEAVLDNPAYENLQREDINAMEMVRTEILTISPTGTEKAFSGKIWLLTSPYVYSASERFADFCKRTGFAALVGQTTGGDGVGSDPALFAMPNSRTLVRFNCEYGINEDGSCNQETGTSPDFETDTPLKTCLEIIKR